VAHSRPAGGGGVSGGTTGGIVSGHLRAYDSATGRTLWDVNTVNEYDTVNRIPARGGR